MPADLSPSAPPFPGASPAPHRHRPLLLPPPLLSFLTLVLVTLASCRPAPDSSSTPASSPPAPASLLDDEFQRLTSQGRGFVDSGAPERAVEVFRRAVTLQPTHPDARQNLINALLRASEPAAAATEANHLLALNENLGAAHYLLGAALLRLGQSEQALQQLQIAKDIDHTVNAVSYLLARAHQDLGHFEDAAALYDEVLQFDPQHPSAHYNLSQVLTRLGRAEDATRELDAHRAVLTQRAGASVDASTVEACVYTEIRVPFRLDPPDPVGIPVTFTDATPVFLGPDATRFAGPIGILDVNHRGTNDLIVREGDAQFRLLLNRGSRLEPAPNPIPVTPGARYSRVLVGDLNKDRYEDIVILGDRGLHAFRAATNAQLTDSTAFSNLRNLPAADGLLADLDFTGNLDLVLVSPADRSLQVLRNLGNMYFTNGTATAGFPADLAQVTSLLTDDWNGDELNDFLLTQPSAPPRLFTKQRGGPLTPSPITDPWPAASAATLGDINNDLRNDLLLAAPNQITILLNGFTNRIHLPLPQSEIHALRLLDYDNDGWLDLFALTSSGLRAWRNRGHAGFEDTTQRLGFHTLPAAITDLAAADLDNDGDTDLVLALADQGLRILRNDGANAHHQLHLRLLGTRSNPSGLGLRIELTSGNWRALRTVHSLPVEIGVGHHTNIDSLNVRWFDSLSTDVDLPVSSTQQLALIELVRPTGSCPYLYRWNGQRFEFVTDLLGGAPLGLPVAQGRYVAADPDEIVLVGTSHNFQPRDGRYLLQITEELREVLYLDHARLLVVDHPLGTEVQPTDKLVPDRPFAPTGLALLHQRRDLRNATDLEGREVTDLLLADDQLMVSPPRLRPPQQRGYAEPHGVILDFGPLDPSRPLVLALTGWLRFGGGMANMSASRDPEIPFPFPRLEAELNGTWSPLEVVPGAPCGKTKTILIDLAGRLAPGTTRLRLTTSFEIHWDRIALFESIPNPDPASYRVVSLLPAASHLHWRGYSEFRDLPNSLPLTPDYDRVRSWPDWRITPSGWCTRYGPVDELIAQRDGGLVLINGGDELTLEFPESTLPSPLPNTRRAFFLLTVGWDKDADFHVVQGDRVEPLPWEGMDDQRYGFEPRPPQPGDELNRRFNTRWVGPLARLRR